MQEPWELQAAHDLENERKEKAMCHCDRCGGVIWEDKAVYYNDQWYCLECESDAWKDIRENFLERTGNDRSNEI